MKWLKRVKLINWLYFDEANLDFGRQTMISGRNSAGKSTIIDALQVLFIANQRQIRFNMAAMQEAKRTLLSYLRGKVGREDKMYLREDDFSSYIAAEFWDDKKKETFVIGVVFDVYQNNHIDEEYFILAEKSLEEMNFTNSFGQLMNREDFHRYYENNRSQTIFERNKSSYQKALLKRMGQVEKRFLTVFPKALAFKPIDNIRDFVCSFILEKQDLQLEIMRQNFEIYEQYKKELNDLKERQEQLKKISNHYNQYIKWCKLVAEEEYVIRRLHYLEQSDLYRKYEQEIVILEQSSINFQNKVDLIIRGRNENQQNVQDAYNRWKNHDSTIEEAKLNNQIKLLKEQIDESNRLLNVMKSSIHREICFLDQFQNWSGNEYWNWQLTEKQYLTDTINLLSSLSLSSQINITNVDEIKSGIVAFGDWLTRLSKRCQKGIWSLDEQIKNQKKHQIELDKQIQKLKNNERSYPDAMERLKSILEKQFLGKSQVWIFCEAIELLDENWRNALEGYLNTQRFDLLVEPEVFAEALTIYEQEKITCNLENIGLVDTEKEKKYLFHAKVNSLASILSTNNPVIQARINHLLGSVMKAQNEQDLRNYQSAITPSCMTYINLVARQIPKYRYETPYIGEQAIIRQLEIKQNQLLAVLKNISELEEIRAEIAKWNEGLEEKRATYVGYADQLLLPKQIDEFEFELGYLVDKLAKLDMTQANCLKEEYDKAQNCLNESDDAHTKAVRDQERIQTELKNKKNEKYSQKSDVDVALKHWEDWKQDYPEWPISDAEAVFENADSNSAFIDAGIQKWAKSQKSSAFQRDSEFKELRDCRYKYNEKYFVKNDIETTTNIFYQSLLNKIGDISIPEYQKKLDEALQQSEEEFKSHFIYKLREAIHTAKQEFLQINYILQNFPYSNDRYHFEVSPSERYKKFYEVIMDPQVTEKGSLFDVEQINNENVDYLRELFQILIHGTSVEQDEFTDYRRYLDFEIFVHNSHQSRYPLSKVIKEKSGGETQTPFYISILASFHNLYSDKTMRIVVFDEAFNKMDEERIQTTLRLIKTMNLQLIAVVPDEKMHLMAPEVTTTIMVHREGDHSFVDIISQQAVEGALNNEPNQSNISFLQAQDSFFSS